MLSPHAGEIQSTILYSCAPASQLQNAAWARSLRMYRYSLMMTPTHVMSESQVIWMKRVTVRYDQREDRLLLTCSCENGAILGLWLTQRLATLLIKVLLAKLEQNAPLDSVATQSRPSIERERALRHWEQSTAHEKQLASAPEPVALPAGTSAALVDQVIASIERGRARLDFRVDGGEPVSLAMSVLATRQWLAIMRAEYRRGDWNIPGLWPAWFDAALRDRRTATDKVH